MTTQDNKIELKSYFSNGYLPKDCSYKNYTMIVAIANYSENPVCKHQARGLLEEGLDVQHKENYLKRCGSFMSAICTKDFATAWNRADGSNREALIQGLKNNEIEL